MSETLTQINKIKEYYEERSKTFQGSATVSMPDKFLIDLENAALRKYLIKRGRLLDAGCANGYSSLEFAKVASSIQIKGIDYSESMVKDAQNLLSGCSRPIQKRVSFIVGDVLNLKEKDRQYDQVISKRCIINLASWEFQQKALREFIRVLKPGGSLLLSEASVQGWRNMNRLRKEFGLAEIPQPWHNLYVDENKLFGYVEPWLKLVEVSSFSSTYYIGSRVLQPFVIGKGTEPRYDSEINRLFTLLPNVGDYGTQKLYIFRKRQQRHRNTTETQRKQNY